jgi:hypothetical protein
MEAKYAGMSPYNYAFNNPVMWNDLSGASPGDEDKNSIPPSNSDNTRYVFVNPYEEPKEYGHLTPDGGRIRFPRGVNITNTVDEGEQFHINGTDVDLDFATGSVISFTFEGLEYFANVDENNKFKGYYTSDQQHYITYDSKNLPSNLNTKEAGSILLVGWTAAGQTALADGPQPGIADVGAVLFGIGATALSTYTLFDAASGYVTMSRPRYKAIEDVSTKPIALPYADAIIRAQEDQFKDYFVKYTNAEGLAKFLTEGVLRPNDKGLVYLTKAFLTPEEVERDIFIGDPYGKGRGDYMLIFFVDPDQSANIQKSTSDPLEWTYYGGNLKIRQGNLLYVGPNPKR